MNDELPLYEVQELSLEEALSLLGDEAAAPMNAHELELAWCVNG